MTKLPLAFVLVAAALLGSTARAPASADGAAGVTAGGYRFVRPPIAIVSTDRDGTVFTIAARLNKAAPPAGVKGRIQLEIAPVGAHDLAGGQVDAYSIGLKARHCFFEDGVGRGEAKLPASLRRAKSGQKVQIAMIYGTNGRINTTVRLQHISTAQIANEAHYSRSLGCAH